MCLDERFWDIISFNECILKKEYRNIKSIDGKKVCFGDGKVKIKYAKSFDPISKIDFNNKDFKKALLMSYGFKDKPLMHVFDSYAIQNIEISFSNKNGALFKILKAPFGNKIRVVGRTSDYKYPPKK